MAVYDPSTLGTATNRITFNDDSQAIYFRLTDRFPVRRQLREKDIPLPEVSGIADFQTLIGKVNYILEGKMYPDTDENYDVGKRQLRKLGSLTYAQDDASSDDGYVPYEWTEEDGFNKRLMIKVLYVDLRESSRNGLKLPFRLFCKVKYPVVTSQQSITANLGSSTSSVSGSSDLPWVLPLSIGLTSYSSNGTITNQGDLGAYPTITIVGPITAPKITNQTTGEYMEFAAINLATPGDTLSINYDQDSISVTQAGNSVLNRLTSGSKLFKIRPGANTLTLSGATIGAGAYATVSINHTWPLS